MKIKLQGLPEISLLGATEIKHVYEKIKLPDELKKTFNSALSIGYTLSRQILNTLVDGPNQIYYFHYQRVNTLLDMSALKISAFLQEAGFEAFPVPASQVIDWQKMEGAVPHRDVAIASGLAWHGKNNLAVNPLYGSCVRYATILTDAPYEEIELPRGNSAKNWGCGECKECIVACPAGAIGNSPEDFKIELCIKKLKEFQKERNISQMVCGMCIKFCKGENRS
ncbi:MAG: hypothetical protein AB1633_01800 [Elusimicrobiota bacterium]